MTFNIENLKNRRKELLDGLTKLGEFRRGTISENYSKCGKPQCWCAEEGLKGHGPRYICSVNLKGRTVSKHLQFGPELKKYIEETERYKKFVSICDELVEVNGQLCDCYGVEEFEGEKELESLKKKLQKRLQK